MLEHDHRAEDPLRDVGFGEAEEPALVVEEFEVVGSDPLNLGHLFQGNLGAVGG